MDSVVWLSAQKLNTTRDWTHNLQIIMWLAIVISQSWTKIEWKHRKLMHKYEDWNTRGLRELSGGLPFGWLRRDAASLLREFEVLEVFHKRNYPKGLGSWGRKSSTTVELVLKNGCRNIHILRNYQIWLVWLPNWHRGWIHIKKLVLVVYNMYYIYSI